MCRQVLSDPDQEHPDGVHFDADATSIGRTRQENEYGGLRIRTPAEVGGARIVVNVDRPIVWVTATQDVPELRRGIARILAEEYPDWEAR